MYQVIGYMKANGSVPVEEFLNGLPKKLRAKTLRSLLMLQEWGTGLLGDEVKHLQDGIFEVRSRFGSDITRVLFFFIVGNRIVLTHGFVKKTQKTPREEIDRAFRYRRDWKERNDVDA